MIKKTDAFASVKDDIGWNFIVKILRSVIVNANIIICNLPTFMTGKI